MITPNEIQEAGRSRGVADRLGWAFGNAASIGSVPDGLQLNAAYLQGLRRAVQSWCDRIDDYLALAYAEELRKQSVGA